MSKGQGASIGGRQTGFHKTVAGERKEGEDGHEGKCDAGAWAPGAVCLQFHWGFPVLRCVIPCVIPKASVECCPLLWAHLRCWVRH